MPGRAIPQKTDRHRGCENSHSMLDLFKLDPERVRWDLVESEDGLYRLMVHHARGRVVETFRTREQALARIHKLEELLLRALEADCSQSESPR
jgi:hypothetical protein